MDQIHRIRDLYFVQGNKTVQTWCFLSICFHIRTEASAALTGKNEWTVVSSDFPEH